jgi:AsmA family
MKKIKKVILFLAIGLVVLIIAAVVIVGFFLDDIVKKGVETVGPQITKTSVTLDGVHLSLLTGSASVKGLVVGNPKGYKTPQIISIGKIGVSIVPTSVMSDKIVVHSIEIRSADITFEGNPFGENNLKKIMDNVNGTTQNGTVPVTNPNAAAPAGSKPAKKLEVDDFFITGVNVHASITGLDGKDFTVPIPEIHFTDLGKGNDGITASELTQMVLKEVSTDTIKAVGDEAKKIAGSTANDLIKGAGAEKLKKGLGSLLGN